MTRHPAAPRGDGKPPIILSSADYDRLADLIEAARGRMPDVASGLAEELDRAQVLPDDRCPDDIVRMGRWVEFRDDTTGRVFRQTLVYPEAADITRHRISVLTPVGTALIGLRAGQSITWKTRSGEVKRLTVLDVGDPPEA